MRRRLATLAGALALAWAAGTGPAAAEPIRIYAAGSLGAVMPKLITAAGLGAESKQGQDILAKAGLLPVLSSR